MKILRYRKSKDVNLFIYIDFRLYHLLMPTINLILTFILTVTRGEIMKVNVANYLIGDLSNRFPISSRNPIDNDLIDVMVDKWSKRQYSGTDINISFCDGKTTGKRYLM